jgi:Ran GTPase-activating protein (RanGAP) involved in mRNA processing and transport
MRSLLERKSNSSKLSIDYCNKRDIEDIQLIAKYIEKNKKLKTLELDFRGEKSEESVISKVVKALEKNNNVRELRITNAEFNDEDVSSMVNLIKDNVNITKLILFCNNFSKEGVTKITKALEKNKSITFLAFEDTEFGEQDAVCFNKFIKDNKSLSFLQFDYDGFRDKDKETLTNTLIKNTFIKELNVTSSSNIEEYIVKLLKKNATIEAIGTSSTINDAGIKKIAKALKENKTIKDIELCGVGISNKGLKYITEALKGSKTIEEINLSENEIDAEGAKYIAEILRETETLQRLNINENSIKSEGVSYITKALKSNKTLKKLSLVSNNIDAEGAEYIAELLRKSETLEKLYLSKNSIKAEGLAYIADALESNKTLEKLKISSNQIGNEGAEYISKILKNNETITKLNIGNNDITTKGGEIIAKALKSNKTIEEFNIANNSIKYFDDYSDTKVYELLAEALESSTNLKKLTFDGVEATRPTENFFLINKIGKWFLKAIKNNKTIEKIKLNVFGGHIMGDTDAESHFDFYYEYAKEIKSILQKNCQNSDLELNKMQNKNKELLQKIKNTDNKITEEYLEFLLENITPRYLNTIKDLSLDDLLTPLDDSDSNNVESLGDIIS